LDRGSQAEWHQPFRTSSELKGEQHTYGSDIAGFLGNVISTLCESHLKPHPVPGNETLKPETHGSGGGGGAEWFV